MDAYIPEWPSPRVTPLPSYGRISFHEEGSFPSSKFLKIWTQRRPPQRSPLTGPWRQPEPLLLWPPLGLSAVPGAGLPLWPCEWVEGRWWMCWDQMGRWSHLLWLPSYFWLSSCSFGLGLLTVHLTEEEGVDSEWENPPVCCRGRFAPSFWPSSPHTDSFSKSLTYLFYLIIYLSNLRFHFPYFFFWQGFSLMDGWGVRSCQH